MIEVDPIHETERVIGEEITALARRVVDCTPAAVHVHFRDDTIVYLLEGDGVPGPDSALTTAMDEGLGEMVRHTLGRRLIGPVDRTRLSGRSLLVVLRLN